MQTEKFWADDSNKENLQDVSWIFFQSKLAEDNVDIPLSGYLSNRHDSSKCINKINGVTNERPDLRISEL